MENKYYVGQKLKVMKNCGFLKGQIVPITAIEKDGIVIDDVALMQIDVVDNCFKPVPQEGVKEAMYILKCKLDNLKMQQTLIDQEIRSLKKSCGHEDLFVDTCGTATCRTCGSYFSWYCPTSPNLCCDYEHEDGHYDEDDCRYCGEPEERK